MVPLECSFKPARRGAVLSNDRQGARTTEFRHGARRNHRHDDDSRPPTVARCCKRVGGGRSATRLYQDGVIKKPVKFPAVPPWRAARSRLSNQIVGRAETIGSSPERVIAPNRRNEPGRRGAPVDGHGPESEPSPSRQTGTPSKEPVSSSPPPHPKHDAGRELPSRG